jgi:protein SCO1/2
MFVIFLCLAFCFPARAQSLTESNLTQITFDQKLNSQISLDLPFRDENGKKIKLGDYFGKKPVVLVLGYYECPMLCTLTFNGMVESMEDMKWSIGNQFNVVHVSINPDETPELAAAKKKSYLRRYGRAGAAAGWHFLTGKEPAIRKLADEVGFHYAYDPTVKQYAHPSGLIVVTPEGKVAKYFFGVTFSPNDLYAALKGATENKVGSPIERLVLLCFHYSPLKGKYGKVIMATVRVLGVITLIGLGWMFIAMIRREKKRSEMAVNSSHGETRTEFSSARAVNAERDECRAADADALSERNSHRDT